MTDATQSILNLAPTVIGAGVLLKLTDVMINDKKKRKSGSVLDTVKSKKGKSWKSLSELY